MKFDLHVHSYFSRDAINNPERIVRFFLRKKMGFAITDHDNCDAWPAIRKYAEHYGVECVLGEEIKVFDGKKFIGELLGYFMNAPIEPGDYRDVLDQLREQAALVAIAHPFDILREPMIQRPIFSKPERAAYIVGNVHAVEAFNSRCVLKSFNKKAVDFAHEKKLALLGGSDAHFPEELGKAFTQFEGNTAEELRHAIKKKKTNCYGTLSHPFVHVITTVNKHTKHRKDY